MSTVQLITTSKHTTLVTEVQKYITFLNTHFNLSERVILKLHDHEIISYGDYSDCQIDMTTRTIYYSLFDIERYQIPYKRYNHTYSGIDMALFEIIWDLNLALTKCYIADQQNMPTQDFMRHYDTYEDIMYTASELLSTYYFQREYHNRPTYTSGLVMSFSQDIKAEMKSLFRQFSKYVQQHVTFPIKLNIKVHCTPTTEPQNVIYRVPRAQFNYPNATVNVFESKTIATPLSTFDRHLNILRRFAYAIGLYDAYAHISYAFNDPSISDHATRFEDTIIQSFIDDVYATHYQDDHISIKGKS